MPPLIGQWIVFEPLLCGAVDVLLEFGESYDLLRRLDRDAHLVPIVRAREVQAVSGRPDGTPQDESTRSDIRRSDMHDF